MSAQRCTICGGPPEVLFLFLADRVNPGFTGQTDLLCHACLDWAEGHYGPKERVPL